MLLVSNETCDSEVLLVSFELEQMLSEIPPGHHAPKVGSYTADTTTLCVIREALFQQVVLVSRYIWAEKCFFLLVQRESSLCTCPSGHFF